MIFEDNNEKTKNMKNRKELCSGCECEYCHFDYGYSVCSVFGSALCRDCVGFKCDTCTTVNNRPSGYIDENKSDCPDRIVDETYKMMDKIREIKDWLKWY